MTIRSGRINIDNNDDKFNKLNGKLNSKTALLFDHLTNYIKSNYPQLKRATGSWYINYCLQLDIAFFKIEPHSSSKCVYIAVHNEDYPLLSKQLQDFVQEKPKSNFHNHGNWKYQAQVKNDSDLKRSHQLLQELHDLVQDRYYKKITPIQFP